MREPRLREMTASLTMNSYPIPIQAGRPETHLARLRFSALASLILCCLVPLSCDDTIVDPFDNDGDIYSVFGFLSLYRTQHFVRVVPVTRYPERIASPNDPQAEIDARVHTVDLATGLEVPWRHSLVRLDDGSYGHVFSASFETHPGRSYRLVVTRSDGKTATAETRIPYSQTENRLEFDPSPALEFLANGERILPIKATLHDAFLPMDVVVEYSVYSIRPSPFRVQKVHPIEIDYGRQGMSNQKGQIQFIVNFTRDAQLIAERIVELRAQDLLGWTEMQIQHVNVKMRVLDEQWVPEGGAFNPAELSLPGTLSNVENGFGFFGAIGHLEKQFELGEAYNRVFGFSGI